MCVISPVEEAAEYLNTSDMSVAILRIPTNITQEGTQLLNETDKLTAFPVSSGFTFITVLSGSIGNVLLIYLSFLKSKLMTVINQLLLLQCIINLSECCFLIPIRSVLIGTAVIFPTRNQLCRVILSWTYANWANFCFSLFVISTIRQDALTRL
ncbi:hypothetical protein SK128_002592 [Halocaridina rubra]|uniref:G-protein coupled receptors family 1 profile domain-containing protein n=1 Tax=Halocaridina rubra TaxID=373956 RepID=A0AAN9AAK5_HALRR